MKHLIFVAGLALAAAYPAYAEGETKKVCVDVKGKDGKPEMDKKTGKVKQSYKEVKVHKKHEGTAVPEKKK